MPEISEALSEVFNQHADTPDHREQVIVTLNSGADPAELSRRGMEITLQMRNRPIAVGTITAATLESLSDWDGVARIELDSSDMRALD